MPPLPPLLAALLLLPGVTRANGQASHLWISERAATLLPAGELRDIMTDPELTDMWRNGSDFPDGGYAIGDGYGEIAHWWPFQQAYSDWILETYGAPPYSDEAAEHVAFLMGMASHGMADQVYDSLFIERAHQEDAASDPANSLDEATDVAFAGFTGPPEYGEFWLPEDLMAELMADAIGHEVSATTIHQGQALVRVAAEWAGRAASDDEVLAEYHAQFPWACRNQMTPALWGNPPDEAQVVALYWQELWGRLSGEELPLGPVLATFPAHGALWHQLGDDKVQARVSIAFARALADGGAEASGVTVTDPEGVEHPVEPWLFYSSHVLHLLPQQDWAPATTYTVSVPAGISSCPRDRWRKSTASASPRGL